MAIILVLQGLKGLGRVYGIDVRKEKIVVIIGILRHQLINFGVRRMATLVVFIKLQVQSPYAQLSYSFIITVTLSIISTPKVKPSIS